MAARMIIAAVALFLVGVLAAPVQAVLTDLSSPQEGATVYPGDEVEVTVTVTNDGAKKDIVHVTFELTAEVNGEQVLVGSAKRRMKLDPGETVSETILGVVPDVGLVEEADVTITATAKGRKSKTEDSDAIFLVAVP